MKKFLGIILIIIGFILAVTMKIGPAKETRFLFDYGIWPLIILTAVFLIGGWVMYNKNK